MHVGADAAVFQLPARPRQVVLVLLRVEKRGVPLIHERHHATHKGMRGHEVGGPVRRLVQVRQRCSPKLGEVGVPVVGKHGRQVG